MRYPSDEIQLSPDEVSLCIQRGWETYRASQGFKDKKVSGLSGEQILIIGCYGEHAMCNFLSIPYRSTQGTFRKADLPFNIEVRTRTQRWHDCRVRPTDDDSRRVVHAVWLGEGKVWIPGWIWAMEGKRFRLINPPSKTPGVKSEPFHAVPVRSLRPMEELLDLVCEELSESAK